MAVSWTLASTRSHAVKAGMVEDWPYTVGIRRPCLPEQEMTKKKQKDSESSRIVFSESWDPNEGKDGFTGTVMC